MARWIQRLARLRVTADRGLYSGKAINLAFVIIGAFIGVPFGMAGVWSGIAAGFVASQTLAVYGKRLKARSAGSVLSPAKRRAAVSELITSVAQHLEPSRVNDAELLVRARVPDEALRLVAQDLLAAHKPLAADEVTRLKRVAAQLGLADDATVVKLLSDKRRSGTGAP